MDVDKLIRNKTSRIVDLTAGRLGIDRIEATRLWLGSRTKKETIDKGLIYVSDSRLSSELIMEITNDPMWMVFTFE